MATVVRTEKRKRGFFGMVFLWVFLLFNAGMALVFGVMVQAAQKLPQAANAAEQAGQVIGAGTAFTGIALIWFFGAIITGLLALLTRGGKTVITETVRDR